MPFKENTKAYKINNIEKNIIIGSLLEDGNLALKEKFEEKRLKLINEGYKNIKQWSENITENKHSKKEENFIIKSKQAGTSNKEIADFLGRS